MVTVVWWWGMALFLSRVLRWTTSRIRCIGECFSYSKHSKSPGSVLFRVQVRKLSGFLSSALGIRIILNEYPALGIVFTLAKEIDHGHQAHKAWVYDKNCLTLDPAQRSHNRGHLTTLPSPSFYHFLQVGSRN